MSVPLNILTGMILGDASLIRQYRHAHLKLQHSPKQREYFVHKVSLLRRLTQVNIREYADNGYGYPTLIAETRTNPLYTQLHKRWYIGRRKTVTERVLEPLNEEGLAYWYMDDGSLTIHYRLRKDGVRSPKGREFFFHTQSFSRDEHEILRDFMKRRFGLNMRISPHKKKYLVLGCGAVEGKKLLALICPYVLPEFEYKLDMKYVNLR